MENSERIFTIRTEWTQEYEKNAIRIVESVFHSFNVIRGVGYWYGKREESMTIEIITDKSMQSVIRGLAISVAKVNKQEATFMTSTKLKSELVYR